MAPPLSLLALLDPKAYRLQLPILFFLKQILHNSYPKRKIFFKWGELSTYCRFCLFQVQKKSISKLSDGRNRGDILLLLDSIFPCLFRAIIGIILMKMFYCLIVFSKLRDSLPSHLFCSFYNEGKVYLFEDLIKSNLT